MPTQEELNRTFRYDADTGLLYWKANQGYNATKGEIAGYISHTGRRYIRFQNTQYASYRLIWVYFNGPIPPDLFVDHIDQNVQNDRIENLRLVTPQQSSQNNGKRRHNTTGYPGVEYDKRRARWRARIRYKRGNRIVDRSYLFPTLDEAIAKRRALISECGFHPNHDKVVQ